jgi:Leucine-rich repeat (LRR) protein
MSNSQNIPSLTIQKANLTTIPFDSINHLSALNYLDLSNNILTNIPSNSFNGSSLVTIDLSRNQLTNVQSNSFSGSSLATIDLSYNQLTNVQSNSFSGSSLATVDLSKNQLTNVQSNSFSGSSLVTVDVSFNQITKLATDAFQSASTSPISFNAKNNSLTSLDYDAFKLTSPSISIDVSNNKITEVDEQFSIWIQASTSFVLNLSNNPLPCDATVQWMGTFVICPPVRIILAGTELCPNGQPVYDYLIPYAKCG